MKCLRIRGKTASLRRPSSTTVSRRCRPTVIRQRCATLTNRGRWTLARVGHLVLKTVQLARIIQARNHTIAKAICAGFWHGSQLITETRSRSNRRFGKQLRPAGSTATSCVTRSDAAACGDVIQCTAHRVFEIGRQFADKLARQFDITPQPSLKEMLTAMKVGQASRLSNGRTDRPTGGTPVSAWHAQRARLRSVTTETSWRAPTPVRRQAAALAHARCGDPACRQFFGNVASALTKSGCAKNRTSATGANPTRPRASRK